MKSSLKNRVLSSVWIITAWHFSAGCCVAVKALAQAPVATSLHADGIYAAGEKIHWELSLPGVDEARFEVKKNGFKTISSGTIPLVSGSGVLETSLNEPGTVLVELAEKTAGKELKTLLGAVVEPLKIKPSSPRPADFDDFWKTKIAELNAIPANPVVEPGESGTSAVEYFKVQLDNIGGTHVYGQLARPKGEGKFPAILQVQYAGVYGLPKSNVVARAQQGWIALNIMAHDLALDLPADSYKKIGETTLKNYISFGNDDREKSYFLRMFLGCYRAADYLASRPDWDGRVLVVSGGSQGGFQGLVTAAIHPKITAAMVIVPAGCDSAGSLAEHATSWPWYGAGKDSAGKPKDAAKVAETSLYFDAVNFASRIKCPTLVGFGLIDKTCPPTAVLSAYNQIQGPKEAVVLVNSEHVEKNGSQTAFRSRAEAWLKAMKEDRPIPVKK